MAGCGWRHVHQRQSSGSNGSPPAIGGSPPRSISASRSTNSRLDQTYNTPAVATLILFADQLRWMLGHGGLDWCTKRTQASADHLYGWAEERSWATPFVADPAKRSAVVGTIDLAPELEVAKLNAVLRANGIVDTDGYRKLGRNQVRIGMYPAVDPSDVEALTACIDHLVEHHADLLRPG